MVFPMLPGAKGTNHAPTDCRRFPLDRSLLRLSPDELRFYKEQTAIAHEYSLLGHIHQVAEDAYQIYPYPCIRWYTFTKLGMSSHPAYQHVLDLGTSDTDILVDVGAGFGTDLRKLVSDGFPVQRVVAFDVQRDLWNIGHHLFKSTPESFPARFVQGDIFELQPETSEFGLSSESPALPNGLSALMGQATAIYTGYFFHLFDEDEQRRIALILSRLLCHRPGAIIFGRHKGLPSPGLDNASTRTRPMFCHSPESWGMLWKNILGDRAEILAELSSLRSDDTVAEQADYGQRLGNPTSTPQGSRYMIWSVKIM